MTFSIKTILRAFAAPSHRLRCSQVLWNKVTSELQLRGEGAHEAGAFLLGAVEDRHRLITDVIYYDDLDAHAYDSGVCILHAPAFAKLWSICRERALTVVADIHTHGGGAYQSKADQTNPMVARDGHVAIIAPDFAATPVPMKRLGIYEYQGDHTWIDRSPRTKRGFFYVGRWS
jgi:hypothetical protein